MRLMCTPHSNGFSSETDQGLNVVLYGRPQKTTQGAIGSSIVEAIRHDKLKPNERAWDLMSIALSVIAADTAVHRELSPDGWTREIDLHIAVIDPDFWDSQKEIIEQQLRFLTTDLWQLHFLSDGFAPNQPEHPILPTEDCVALLSGGLDSLVGAINLVTRDHYKPYVVSQVSQGSKETQKSFAADMGGGLRHLQLNHGVRIPGNNDRSQRSRSLIYLAYGVLGATALQAYHEGKTITLYVCENGFISINPPLTEERVGSLSTRTTHPVFINQFQQLLRNAGLRIEIENPYQFSTKGEMLRNCANQDALARNAYLSISCGRYLRFGYQHCGRCIPCLIRRSAFQLWGRRDKTKYTYDDLSLDDDDHARFDDVRSAAMAVAQVRVEGVNSWLGASLNRSLLGDVAQYEHTIERGLQELAEFLEVMGVT